MKNNLVILIGLFIIGVCVFLDFGIALFGENDGMRLGFYGVGLIVTIFGLAINRLSNVRI